MLIVPRVKSVRARLRSLKLVSFRTRKLCGFSHPNRRCLEHRRVRSMKAHYARLFADAGGKPCFEDLSVELISGFAVPPAEPLHTAPFLVPDGATFWIGAPPSWNGGEPHPAPRRMIFITVRGEYEVFTGEGEVRKFRLEVCLSSKTQPVRVTRRALRVPNNAYYLPWGCRPSRIRECIFS
jgi:hypothetical protein